MGHSTAKDATVQLRLRPSQKQLLTRAAAARQVSVSAFMLEHACDAAQRVLAEESVIVMSAGQWSAFQKALDAPPRPIATLRKLMKEPSVFDGRRRSHIR